MGFFSPDGCETLGAKGFYLLLTGFGHGLNTAAHYEVVTQVKCRCQHQTRKQLTQLAAENQICPL